VPGEPSIVTGPKSKLNVSTGGQPVATTRSRRPHSCSRATPCGMTTWVETVSLGKRTRSTSRTRNPRRASSIAVGDPAHRAPTTMTS